ncbi:MAG: DUF3108 domain-containing protein [Verrucomicrobia bacterium]|nr:DUF3108 domain-containing protein [Verrucomicrobiota bacterium]
MSRGFQLIGVISVLLMAPFVRGDDGADERQRLTADDIPQAIRDSIVVPDPDRTLPFIDGEVLHYRIGWGLFEVGTAELSLRKTEWQGEPAWQMNITTRTNTFADTFYKVRNSTTSWLDSQFTRTLHYENIQNEGKRERDVLVEFRWNENLTRYTDRLAEDDEQDWIPVLPGSFDPLAITYFVRSLPLAVGDQFLIATTTGREQFVSTVTVEALERRRFRHMGRMEAFRLVPEIKDVGGVFRRSSRASIYFWFSADERRLPLRMESSVAVGRFWAELHSVTHSENNE